MNKDMARWIDAAATECARKDHASLPELITAFLQAAEADGVKLTPREATDEMCHPIRVRLSVGNHYGLSLWQDPWDAAPNYLGEEP